MIWNAMQDLRYIDSLFQSITVGPDPPEFFMNKALTVILVAKFGLAIPLSCACSFLQMQNILIRRFSGEKGLYCQ